LFVVALILIPKFAYWIHRQERLGRRAIIPPSLWTNKEFTSLCVIVFFVWGCFNATQYFITLYFQLVEDLSPIQTAIRFLPQVIMGTATNMATGWLVKHVRTPYLIICSCIITSICPLLMATIDPTWSYWKSAFFALCFIPICADVLFPAGNLLIISLFPHETHGLAGGVFNTVSNIGNSVGLAITAMITTSVTSTKITNNASVVDAMLGGYRASFWTCFAVHVLVLIVAAFGLRNVGKVGLKAEKAKQGP
jgi:nitrate/nitrite transporter NarK